MEQALTTVAIYALPIFLTLTLPVALQAFVAYRLGDTSQRFTGRLSWDPIKHTDWIGTVALPLGFLALSGAAGVSFLIGWAKQLDVNVNVFKRWRRDLFLVELPVLIGPLLMALLWTWLAALCLMAGIEDAFVYRVCAAGHHVGLIFFAIAMLPLPPFPLGNALLRFLPGDVLYKIMPILPYTPWIVLGLLILGVLRPWVSFFVMLGSALINGLS